MLKSSASRYSVSRTCGPRDVISLVIPRVGDNMSIVVCLYKTMVPIFYTSHGFYKSIESTIGVKLGCPLSPTLWGSH
jgi:hypothetical protein